MYWYYKVFIAAIVGFLLFGVYSALDINMNISTSFFSKDDIEESASTDTAKEDQNNTNKNLVKTVSLDQALTASQQSKLRHAQEIFKKHQLLDDAYEKAMEVLEDKSLIQFTKGWYQVADFINEINNRLLVSSAPSKRKLNYKINSGDSLARIAKHKTTIRGLQKSNNIPEDSQLIHPGDFVRFFPGKWEIEIFQSKYTLILKHQGRFFKYYKVAIGQENRTPLGKFLIYGKVEDPTWERRGHEPIPAGDERNVLGTRWMRLKAIPPTILSGSGYGIHGTTDPQSIGTPASQGCIRMKNEQVEELFDIIPDTIVEVTIRK